MRTQKMRFVSALLVVAMMFVMMPVSAFAADATEYTSGDYRYILNDDGTATISGYNGTEDKLAADNYIVKIPEEFVDEQNVHHVVTMIGKAAFNPVDRGDLPWHNSVCNNIKEVVIPESVTKIGPCAFFSCANLTTVNIPDATTNIDWWGFYFCTNLETVKISKHSHLLTIASNVFSQCKNLKSIYIPDSVTEIQWSAFEGSDQLTEIKIPENVTKIYERAFKGCTKLEEITIPSSVKEIGDNAFANSGLTKIKYTGTQEQWSELVSNSSGTGNNKLTDETVKHEYAHTVTFNNGEAANEQTVVVPYAETVTAPDAKVKGYRIVGYYADPAYNTKFNFDTKITEDTTIYVKWEKIPDHQLTVAGGTFTVKDETVETKTEDDTLMADIPEGAEVTVTFNKDADSNLTFDGWKIEGLVDAENYTNKEEFTFTMPENGVTIKAQTKAKAAAPAEDDSWDTATVVTGVVLGTGTAILAYHIGTELYAEQVLGEGVAVPKTREDVALKAWELAGKPAVELNGEPLSEAAQAEKWAVESGLMQNDANGNFNGAKKMNKLKALRVLDNAKKLNAQ